MPTGAVVMRVGVRDSLAQWVDEKPWRFKLILLFHTAVVGAILLIFGIRFESCGKQDASGKRSFRHRLPSFTTKGNS